MSGDIEVGELLGELGFGADATRAIARAALEAAGLLNPKKQRVSLAKREAIETLLEQRYAVRCTQPACRADLGGREWVEAVPRERCRICHGSSSAAAQQRLASLIARKGLSRWVVVGGSPATHEELLGLTGIGWELRLVDGTVRRTKQKAEQDLDWAHSVVIWGATELDHKVSTLYVSSELHRRKLVKLNKRGVASLLEAMAEHLSRS